MQERGGEQSGRTGGFVMESFGRGELRGGRGGSGKRVGEGEGGDMAKTRVMDESWVAGVSCLAGEAEE
jgi:hypothetical protein